MNSQYGQQNPQNNRYVNNQFVNQYQRSMQNNVPFANNQMLNNNPNFVANMYNSGYYQKMNMEKMERMRRAKSVEDLGVDKEQLAKYIICPLKVEKESKDVLTGNYTQKESLYAIERGKKNNSSIEKLWEKRTNNPYKNILKDENYTKKFNNKDDLIVHKVTKFDKNLKKLMAEYEDMLEFIVIHDGKLEIKYAKSKENKFKEKFDYENKIKYRVKYDPKNYTELKKFYKSEQKKIKKANRRVDEMIEILLASESFTKEELNDIDKSCCEEENVTISFEQGDDDMEKQLEKELAEELADEFDEKEIAELFGHKKSKNKKSKKEQLTLQSAEQVEKNIKPLITVKHKKSANDDVEDKPKKKVTVKKKKSTESTEPKNKVGHVDKDEMTEFKNQKKTKKTKK